MHIRLLKPCLNKRLDTPYSPDLYPSNQYQANILNPGAAVMLGHDVLQDVLEAMSRQLNPSGPCKVDTLDWAADVLRQHEDKLKVWLTAVTGRTFNGYSLLDVKYTYACIQLMLIDIDVCNKNPKFIGCYPSTYTKTVINSKKELINRIALVTNRLNIRELQLREGFNDFDVSWHSGYELLVNSLAGGMSEFWSELYRAQEDINCANRNMTELDQSIEDYYKALYSVTANTDMLYVVNSRCKHTFPAMFLISCGFFTIPRNSPRYDVPGSILQNYWLSTMQEMNLARILNVITTSEVDEWLSDGLLACNFNNKTAALLSKAIIGHVVKRVNSVHPIRKHTYKHIIQSCYKTEVELTKSTNSKALKKCLEDYDKTIDYLEKFRLSPENEVRLCYKVFERDLLKTKRIKTSSALKAKQDVAKIAATYLEVCRTNQTDFNKDTLDKLVSGELTLDEVTHEHKS